MYLCYKFTCEMQLVVIINLEDFGDLIISGVFPEHVAQL